MWQWLRNSSNPHSLLNRFEIDKECQRRLTESVTSDDFVHSDKSRSRVEAGRWLQAGPITSSVIGCADLAHVHERYDSVIAVKRLQQESLAHQSAGVILVLRLPFHAADED